MSFFNIDFSDDKTKAIIVVLIFLALAIYNFFSIPPTTLEKMKEKLSKTHKIYHFQNEETIAQDAGAVKNNSPNTPPITSSSNNTNNMSVPQGKGYQQQFTQNGNQTGGFFGYLDHAYDNRMSAKWDEVPNLYDPARLHDLYNKEDQPMVYQGFGIPLITDLKCSSFAGLSKEIPNGNDRAISKSYDRNTLGTIPSDKASMFYFSDSVSSPECCPGPYSTDQGCVCSFEKASGNPRPPVYS